MGERSETPEIENFAPVIGDSVKHSTILSTSSSPHQLKVKVIRDKWTKPADLNVPSIGGSSVSSLHASSLQSSESLIPITPASSYMLDLPGGGSRMSRPSSKKGVKSAVDIRKEAAESLTLPVKKIYSWQKSQGLKTKSPKLKPIKPRTPNSEAPHSDSKIEEDASL